MQTAQYYIKRCLELAQKAKGFTAPNPMVGAVLVYQNEIIGEGWHQQYGEVHAEVNCLESVSEANKQFIPESTMYVSLEPCAHQGKTPSCAKRLVAEKVKAVIVCNDDPFEQVRGKGFQILNEHGIVTQKNILEQEGRWVNRRFFCFHKNKRPYIILKWAQTQNGFFAPSDGSRLQMSNLHSQQLVHKWRTEEAAILVGFNTAMNDDPSLTARLWKGKNPFRIFIDRNLKVPKSHNLYNNETTTWVINTVKNKVENNTHFIQLEFDETLLRQLLQELYQQNGQSLIVEGGANLLQQFIDKGLWDEARIFETENLLSEGIFAPKVINANYAFNTNIGNDILQVWVNSKSEFSYVNGMEL